jgi:hypothetical protein
MQIRRRKSTSSEQRAFVAREGTRSGVATLDYILILCVLFPLFAFIMPAGKRMIELSYEMICVMFAWPFM